MQNWVDFLVKFIFESDAIEGIEDNRELLRKEILENKVNGHVGAMLLLKSLAEEQVNQYLDHSVVCLVQNFITFEQHLKKGGPRLDPKHIGSYRTVPVTVGGSRCPSQEKTPTLMEKLLGKVHWMQSNFRFLSLEEIIGHIADFHYRFEKIHPFADGNGRTGRALIYFLFVNAGIEPFVFTNNDKYASYYPCFRDETSRSMKRYFFTKIERGLK